MTATKIDWATHVWNPVTGCSPVSAGCEHCYAAGIARRFWKGRPFSDVQFHPDRRAFLKRAEHNLKMAYAMTCHKMQGSEVPVVILPLHRSLSRLPMVTREWIYTAFSRAKSFIITVGDVDAIAPMVRKVAVGLRKTTLADRLQSLKWSHL